MDTNERERCTILLIRLTHTGYDAPGKEGNNYVQLLMTQYDMVGRRKQGRRRRGGKGWGKGQEGKGRGWKGKGGEGGGPGRGSTPGEVEQEEGGRNGTRERKQEAGGGTACTSLHATNSYNSIQLHKEHVYAVLYFSCYLSLYFL